MNAARFTGRVVLVMENYPSDSPFLAAKFAGLRNRGDVWLVCLGRESRRARRALRQADGGADPIRFGWPTQPGWLAVLMLPFVVTTCLVRNPSATVRYLRTAPGGWPARLRRLYVDAPIVALGPDLVHFEFGTLALGRMHLRRALGSRVVVSFRGYDINYAGLDDPSHYDEVWSTADCIHFLGNDLRQRALRRGCPPSVPSVLIPPAIDTDYFKSLSAHHDGRVGTNARPVRILSVGRVVWKKGYEFGLDAVALLQRRDINVEYRIVGDGDHVAAVGFGVHQLGLGDRVTLLGGLGRDAIREQMAWADIVLHPAVSEGFCNAVVEAQSMEVPVVCSDADGLRENVADGVTGFVVRRRDPEAMADRLATLAEDGTLRVRMGRAGRERAERLFQIEQQIDRFAELYRDLLSGRGGQWTAASDATLSPVTSRDTDDSSRGMRGYVANISRAVRRLSRS